MSNQIQIEDIYNHNLNILIGSGASFGLFPTLALSLKDEQSNALTIETLAEHLESTGKIKLKTLLFMHYFQVCIKPVLEFDIHNLRDIVSQEVIKQYKIFLNTLLIILHKRQSPERRCNIFTTNYDGCIALSADQILCSGQYDFIINDGSRGFRRKFIQARNFNSFLFQTGIFGQTQSDVPQINLIHLHGSAYWKKESDNIVVDYQAATNYLEIKSITAKVSSLLDEFNQIVSSRDSSISSFDDINLDALTSDIENDFWTQYKQIPVVNPEKWKFHETVFEEHYYQMLRALSYELEKPSTVFITFGFSFADEHILNLIKRSLSNDSLQLFICCFNKHEKDTMEKKFRGYRNVQYINTDDLLTFNVFNEQVFTLSPAHISSKG